MLWNRCCGSSFVFVRDCSHNTKKYKGYRMKKMGLMALLVGAALFTGLGGTAALAESKCGAGKCGSEVQKPVKGKCGDGKMMKPEGKCGAKQDGKCGDGKPMRPGKCSGEKTAPMNGKCTGK